MSTRRKHDFMGTCEHNSTPRSKLGCDKQEVFQPLRRQVRTQLDRYCSCVLQLKAKQIAQEQEKRGASNDDPSGFPYRICRTSVGAPNIVSCKMSKEVLFTYDTKVLRDALIWTVKYGPHAEIEKLAEIMHHVGLDLERLPYIKDKYVLVILHLRMMQCSLPQRPSTLIRCVVER